ncbi:hypothetical protein NW767_014007 [Fusarium falciforme]|nr:hypothetical protein NW767_014007 [Fusarium falciforme]
MASHVRATVELESPAELYPENDDDVVFHAEGPEPRITTQLEEHCGFSGRREQRLDQAQQLLDQPPTRRHTYNRIHFSSLNRTTRDDTEPADPDLRIVKEHLEYDVEIARIFSANPPK